MEKEKDKEKKVLNWLKALTTPIKIALGAVSLLLVVGLVIAGVAIVDGITSRHKAQIITSSSLREIINVADLNTFEAFYNGIAEVPNEKNPEKIDYYVSYEAKVKVGIDFEEVIIEVDRNNKTVIVTIPPLKLQEPTVDITTLDFIFLNSKANTLGVTGKAYDYCIQDAWAEASAEPALFEHGLKNAEATITALIKPFINQMDAEYKLEIRHGGTEE